MVARQSLVELAGGATACIALLVGGLACSSAPNQASPGQQTGNAAVTAEGLLSAPVPGVCTHKAGKLFHGAQPGIPAGHGGTELAWLGRGPQVKAALTAVGNLSGDGEGDAATVLACNAGGVPWPDVIVFYSPGPKLLGWAYLTDFNLPGIHAQENASALKISYRRDGVEVEWSTQQEGDAAAISTLDYSATLRLSGHKILASDLIGTTEQPTARAFLEDLRRGDRAAAKQLATPTALAAAAILIRSFPSTLTAPPKCYGLNDLFTMPAPLAALIDPGGPSQVSPLPERLCAIHSMGPKAIWIALGMERTGFRTWRVLWSVPA